jgi:small-conductance mechanosensitive channel
MWQLLTIILLAAVTALLWLSSHIAAAFSMFGSSAVPDVLRFAAAAATASLFVVSVGQLILRGGFAAYGQVQPTGLQRGLVLSVLIFAAVAGLLAHLGVDLSTLLTTSALVTAIVGLSIQPTLASLLSGLAIDRAMRVGDGVLINGEVVEVTSLSWRAVIGLKPDGGRIVIPNSKLADNILEILPHTRPARAEVIVTVKDIVTPHQLNDVIRQVLADMDAVDLTQQVNVVATTAKLRDNLARYRVTFWVRHYAQRGPSENDFLRRSWYTFEREKLVERSHASDPAPDDAGLRAVGEALRSAGLPAGKDGLSQAKVRSTIETGEMLSYGDGERITLPGRIEGNVCVLISGTLAESVSPSAATSQVPLRQTQQLPAVASRQAWLNRIQHLLALRIGPYAEHAVRSAAGRAVAIAEVCTVVAQDIDDPAEREAFLREVNPPAERIQQPGFLFRSRRDGAGRLRSDPPLTVVDQAVILAVPHL